jgi:hypothetical protein
LPVIERACTYEALTVPGRILFMSISNLKDQIAAANENRKNIMRALYNSIRLEKGKIVSVEVATIQTIAIRATDEGFSARDFQFFQTLYSGFRSKHIAAQNELATLMQDKVSKEGRYPSWMKFERDKATNLAAKCSAMIDIINAEMNRRVEAAKNQRETEAREHAEWLQKSKLEAEARKNAVREAEAKKREEAAKKPKLQGITLYGSGMEALALLTIENRKAGKFVSERKIKKAEAVELVGDENALSTALAIAKQNNSEVVVTLADYRVITAKKNGAATMYGIRE